MAYEDSLGQLAAQPLDEGQPTGPLPGPMQGMAEQSAGLGGPGVDTPQEQKAVDLLMKGAMMFREAAQTDPSVRPIIDKILQDGFLQVSEHYGFGEEGKLAVKQAQLTRNRAQASAFGGGGPRPSGPPIG